MKVVELKPPSNITLIRDKEMSFRSLRIFLAGTIDMGNSEDWQTKIRKYFSDKEESDIYRDSVILYNPRRDEWDSSWTQEFVNPQFYQQVNWELNALEKADIIIINILPTSKSPITLLELGLFARTGKVKVCCPEGFYRKGNVDIVCDRYGIPMYNTIEELLDSIKV